MFVNTACVSLDVLILEFGRLKVREPPSVVVCIMTGIITDCYIVSDSFSQTINKSSHQ